MLQVKVSLHLFDLQFSSPTRLFAYPSVRFAAQHHNLSSTPWLTVSPTSPQSTWRQRLAEKSWFGTELRVPGVVQEGPVISCTLVLLLYLWFWLRCVRHPPGWDVMQHYLLHWLSTGGGLKVLTMLLVQSQTDFLIDHRPYFRLSKALHEVNIIQHWALVKGLDEPGGQLFSFVAGRSSNEETETTYLSSCWPRRKNVKPAWDNKGQRVIFWKKQKPAQSFAYSTKILFAPSAGHPDKAVPHFGAKWPRF